MRRVLLVTLALAACGEDSGPVGTIAGHVTHYDYTFDIESRAAHAKLSIVIDTAGDCITLPFRATDLAAVKIDGDAASATQDDTSVTVCGSGYDTGKTITLEADMVVPLATLADSQVGYSITRDSQQNPFYYLVSWVGGCDRFTPCDNRPDQFATYKFTVTHPDTFKARCPGTITEVSATETTCEFDHEGGPTYSTFGIAAYPAWTVTDKGTWDGVRVTLYDRAQTMIDAKLDTTYHAGFVEWMQSQFGPYPFGDELRILTAPTYWAGFEHPGNIVLDDGLARIVRPAYWDELAHTLDHEITHMWAGDQTTIAGLYDFVWKESMAEYLTYVYEDMTSPMQHGPQTAGVWKASGASARYWPVPMDSPALFDFYGDVYGPGPMVLFRQLEVMYGRDKILAGLQTLLGHAHAIGVDDVIAALEASTGQDLDAYAAAWIKGSGAPDWPRYALVYTAATNTLSLDQVNEKANARGCKFHVALRGANAGEQQLVEVDTRTQVDQTITVTAPTFTVTSLQLDPQNECLVYLASSSPRSLTPSHFDVVRPTPWLARRADR